MFITHPVIRGAILGFALGVSVALFFWPQGSSRPTGLLYILIVDLVVFAVSTFCLQREE